MTLQASGAIALSQIQAELGGANPISLSEYYRGGAYTGSNNASVPTGGKISMSNFYGAGNAFELVYSNFSQTTPFAAPASATSDTITIAWTGAHAQTGVIQDPICTGAGFVAIDDYAWTKTEFEDTANGRGHISWFNGAAAGKNPFTAISSAGYLPKFYGMSVWRKPSPTVTAVTGGFWKTDNDLDDTVTRWGTAGQTLCLLWATVIPAGAPSSSNLLTATFNGVGAELIQNPYYCGLAIKVLDTSVTPSPFINTNNVGPNTNWRTNYIRA